MAVQLRAASRSSWRVIALAALAIVAAMAVWLEIANPGSDLIVRALDTTVGLAFLTAAAITRGPAGPRGLFGLVGVTWLLGGLTQAANVAHVGALFVALATFPTGLVVGASGVLVAGIGVALALALPVWGALVPPLLVATLFGAVALRALIRLPEQPTEHAYPLVASAAVAVAVVAASLLAYQITMLGIALFFPIAMVAVAASKAALADRLLEEDRPAGMAGLAVVLGEAIGDPSLRIERWHEGASGFADREKRVMTVDEQGMPIAVVAHRAAALEDPATASAVREAVRLAVMNERLQDDLDSQVVELEAARARLLVAIDRQRALIADRLRADVVAPVQQAERLLAGTTASQDEAAAGAVEVAQSELAAVADDLLGVVGGASPLNLGEGGLVGAIRSLGERSPVPVHVTAAPDAVGSPDAEATLFYVCSEAITNAVKHAEAARIDVGIERDHGELIVRITDDGRGGADPGGTGLMGLSERLAARGGRLRVESPPGAGTVVVGAVPG